MIKFIVYMHIPNPTFADSDIPYVCATNTVELANLIDLIKNYFSKQDDYISVQVVPVNLDSPLL